MKNILSSFCDFIYRNLLMVAGLCATISLATFVFWDNLPVTFIFFVLAGVACLWSFYLSHFGEVTCQTIDFNEDECEKPAKRRSPASSEVSLDIEDDVPPRRKQYTTNEDCMETPYGAQVSEPTGKQRAELDLYLQRLNARLHPNKKKD